MINVNFEILTVSDTFSIFQVLGRECPSLFNKVSKHLLIMMSQMKSNFLTQISFCLQQAELRHISLIQLKASALIKASFLFAKSNVIMSANSNVFHQFYKEEQLEILFASLEAVALLNGIHSSRKQFAPIALHPLKRVMADSVDANHMPHNFKSNIQYTFIGSNQLGTMKISFSQG